MAGMLTETFTQSTFTSHYLWLSNAEVKSSESQPMVLVHLSLIAVRNKHGEIIVRDTDDSQDTMSRT